MKVVLFCGGLGLRMRDATSMPKPMAMLRNRPILWHLMRYYAHYGHKDFILCLGYRGEVIKEFFLNYDECMSNDFVLTDGGRRVEPLAEDIRDWRITFVDTGIESCIGERLRAVRSHLDRDDLFFANYSDGLTDYPLPSLVEFHRSTGAAVTFLAVRPNFSFHIARLGTAGAVIGIENVSAADIWINGGFFVMGPEVFDAIGPGEDLVQQPFARLIAAERLAACRYEGFWHAMDTFKDLQTMEDILTRGPGPWEIWRTPPPTHGMAAE